MWIIRKYINRIKFIFKYKIIRYSRKKKFFIFATPEHNNLGDLAILWAEEVFVKKYFGDYQLVKVSNSDVACLSGKLHKIVRKNDIVTIHGGGFLGTLWMVVENQVREIVSELKDFRIIIFPQSVYYDDNDFGIEQMALTRKVYEKCPNLVICAREEISFELVKKIFPNTQCMLIPDMVLYLTEIKNEKHTFNENKVILCLRNDLEKTDNYREGLVQLLTPHCMNIIDSDMYSKSPVYKISKKLVIRNKIKEFSEARLVITDRLHGMVFSALANTPCVVLPSKSHKVQGVYKWIEKLDYVYMTKNIEEIEYAIECVLNTKCSSCFNINFKNWFENLEQIIRRTTRK